VQAAGRVEQHHVGTRGLRVGDPLKAELRRREALLVEHGHVDLPSEDLELLDGRGALHVGGDEQRAAAVLLAQELRELRAGGGLAGALEARHEHDRRPVLRELEARVLGAHEVDELVMERGDELLARLDALDAASADHALLHAVGELLDDLEVDVRLEQRLAHGAQAFLDVVVGQLLPVAQEGEGLGEAVGEGFEHGELAVGLCSIEPRRATRG
jgi:hypothetical protein